MKKAKLANSEKELENYAVYYKGKLALYLSPRLAVQQDLDMDDLEKLRGIHIKRLELFDTMEAENDVAKLRKLDGEVKEVEFELQDAWKFDRNASFHSWWFKAPKCECPKLDNQERVGTGTFIINENCSLHGGKAV